MSYLVHQLLENSAQQYPDKEAVVYKDNSVTYRELDAVSNQLVLSRDMCYLRQYGL